ncbi:MAG: Dihydroorotate dehydrogenase (quinone) [Ignavibacteria bacterium]|nr:Dihydroorotate dehydrogenase (quinone) [Ignavibacteria bacterium]
MLSFLYNPGKSENIIAGSNEFKNRLGLAAGFDKYGTAIRFFHSLGFSHVEIGTVTPYPQPGNPKPRIFRLPDYQAIINRMGFNNGGTIEVMSNILKARKYIQKDFIIGINIGKNKMTEIENAVLDYKICLNHLYNYADYFTLNVSSPNTEGLRKLQDRDYLDNLLSEIQSENKSLSAEKSLKLKDIFLKIAPDIDDEQLNVIFELCIKHDITGIIATNTTLKRPGINTKTTEEGGLSGKPLRKLSNEILDKLNKLNSVLPDKKLLLIASGGVFNKDDFNEKLRSGAALVQIYTGLIYEGPAIIKKILK